MPAHGAGKTEYVPLHSAAAFPRDGADWNTDFIKQGLWVGRISFQVSQGFQVHSFTGKSSESLREDLKAPRPLLWGWSRVWECDAVHSVVLALTDRSPIPSPCPAADVSFGISFVPQYRHLHLGCLCQLGICPRRTPTAAWISQYKVETAGLGFSHFCCPKYPA